MTQVVITTAPRQFDFKANAIEQMSLDTLRRMHKENDIYGKPVKGIPHFEVIDRLSEMCRRHNLKYEIEEIFAAQNGTRSETGVVLFPQVDEKFGDRAVEAHILRCIYTTIRIRERETDELTTTLVVAFHQSGIQAAIGPCVKCVLSLERSVSNYGRNKVSTDELFERVDGWLRDFDIQMSEDCARIARLNASVLTPLEVYAFIGLLTTLRISHDSADKCLSSQVETYPLNQSRISGYTEDLLKLSLEKPQFTAWDVYNVATEIYRPGLTDIPAMIQQNGALAELLLSDRLSYVAAI